MVQPVLLLVIPRPQPPRKLAVRLLQVFNRCNTPRVIRSNSRASEPLAEDGVAGSQTVRIVGVGENASLDLVETGCKFGGGRIREAWRGGSHLEKI